MWTGCSGGNFSSTTALRLADLEGLLSKDTMGPVNSKPLQDVRMNGIEQVSEERPRMEHPLDNM